MTSKMIQIRAHVPEQMHTLLYERASARGVSVSEILRHIVGEWADGLRAPAIAPTLTKPQAHAPSADSPVTKLKKHAQHTREEPEPDPDKLNASLARAMGIIPEVSAPKEPREPKRVQPTPLSKHLTPREIDQDDIPDSRTTSEMWDDIESRNVNEAFRVYKEDYEGQTYYLIYDHKAGFGGIILPDSHDIVWKQAANPGQLLASYLIKLQKD